MDDARAQSENLVRADLEESIRVSFSREKRGRLRRVDGTERDKASVSRALVKAA